MLASVDERVINVNSGAARRAGADASAYDVSKTALARVTGSTHLAGWARGIRAFDLMPGVVRTDMTSGMDAHAGRTDGPTRPRSPTGAGLVSGVLDAWSGRFVRPASTRSPRSRPGRRPAWRRTNAPSPSSSAAPTPSPADLPPVRPPLTADFLRISHLRAPHFPRLLADLPPAHPALPPTSCGSSLPQAALSPAIRVGDPQSVRGSPPQEQVNRAVTASGTARATAVRNLACSSTGSASFRPDPSGRPPGRGRLEPTSRTS